MRALVVCLIVASSSPAFAERPAIGHHVRPCMSAKSWGEIVACLAHQTLGRGEVVRALNNARVVRMERLADGNWVDNGVAVYVENGGTWRFAGEHRHFGGAYVILTLEAFEVDKVKGYRLDLGIQASLAEAGLLRMKKSMYCRADGAWCRDTQPTCEVMLHGKTVFVFHGTTKIEKGVIHVTGDRSKTGTLCVTPERTPF